MPRRVGAEIEHSRIPQRVGVALNKVGLPAADAAALSKLTDPSNLVPTHRESHAWMDSHAKKGGAKHDVLDDRVEFPLGSATNAELAAIAAALKRPGVNLDGAEGKSLRTWLTDEKKRRGTSAAGWEVP